MALSESAPVAVGKHRAHILIRVVHPTKPKPVPPLRQDRSMYILPACSCCQRRGPPPPRPPSVCPWHSFSGDWLLRVIVLRLENGEQARPAKPKPELEPTNERERWFSGVYHYAIKTTMSPEEKNKRKEGQQHSARDGCIPNFTLKWGQYRKRLFLSPSFFRSLCAVFPAIIPHSHLTSPAP